MPFLGDNYEQYTGISRSLGVPKTIPERAANSFESAVYGQWSFSKELGVRRQLDLAVTRASDRTGQQFVPEQIDPAGGEAQTLGYERAKQESVLKQLAQIKAQHPDLSDLPTTYDELVSLAGQEQRQREEQLALDSQIDPSLSGDVAAFMGLTGGIIADPLLLSTLAYGASLRGSVLLGALKESAIGAAAESVIQYPLQTARQDMGLDGGLKEGATNVLLAATGGGAFYAGFRALGAGARSFKRFINDRNLSPEARQAFDDLEDLVDAVNQNPVMSPSSREAQAHTSTLDDVMVRLENGQTANVSGMNLADLSIPVVRAAEIRNQLMPALGDIGFDIDEIMPGLGKAAEANSDSMQIAMSKAIIDDIAERLNAISGEEAALFQRISEIEEDKAVARASRQLTQERLSDVDLAMRERDFDAARRALDSEKWQEKFDSLGDDKAELTKFWKNAREALGRRKTALEDELNEINAAIGKTDEDALSAREAIEAFEDSKNTAVKLLNDRVASQFTEAEIQSARKSVAASDLGAVESRNLSEQQAYEQHIEAANDAQVKADEALIHSAREDFEERLSQQLDEDMVQPLRDQLDEIDADEAALEEFKLCRLGGGDDG